VSPRCLRPVGVGCGEVSNCRIVFSCGSWSCFSCGPKPGKQFYLRVREAFTAPPGVSRNATAMASI
jgi:hypothetical protein